ncbi:MAG: type II secretion system protein [Peptoniphilaceae bacterium]|nr:type II secretion system GspH family protein [Peptoniphilaceae bacterium]MDD7382833.1 type II secretion system protein [Peptoniphilaceae bacterium]MDY3738208.1 type II secretion system protein [Peptoniphilaceae bacterium]
MKKRGFTLIEVIVVIGLLSIISIYFMPSIQIALKLNKKSDYAYKRNYAMKSAIEIYQNKDIGEYYENIDGFNLNISITLFKTGLNKIEVKCDDFMLDMVVKK